MTKEEELQALREENRTLKALITELLPLKEQLARANARIKELEDRLAKDSRTSSKPPSSDGLARLLRRAGPSLGQSAAKDFWHLSQCDWGHCFLPHSQLSFDVAQARTFPCFLDTIPCFV